MKSAGDSNDRSSEPIRNAITATTSTVDIGYCRLACPLLGVASRSPSPPGSWGPGVLGGDAPIIVVSVLVVVVLAVIVFVSFVAVVLAVVKRASGLL